jgi:ribosomal protein S11
MLFNTSSGLLSIKGSLKTQPTAYKDIAVTIVRKLQAYGITAVILQFKGFSYNRKAFFKIINNSIKILHIIEKTATPFNGCKINAARRI